MRRIVNNRYCSCEIAHQSQRICKCKKRVKRTKKGSITVEFKRRSYPKATVATTTCILEEIQLSKTDVRTLLFSPAWYADKQQNTHMSTSWKTKILRAETITYQHRKCHFLIDEQISHHRLSVQGSILFHKHLHKIWEDQTNQHRHQLEGLCNELHHIDF